MTDLTTKGEVYCMVISSKQSSVDTKVNIINKDVCIILSV